MKRKTNEAEALFADLVAGYKLDRELYIETRELFAVMHPNSFAALQHEHGLGVVHARGDDGVSRQLVEVHALLDCMLEALPADDLAAIYATAELAALSRARVAQ